MVKKASGIYILLYKVTAQGLLVLIFALLFASCSVSKQIGRQATEILLKDSTISTGHCGISIYEPATGKYWFNYNADKYFVPASHVKLFTLYAGMKYLGDSLVGLRYMEEDTVTTIFPTADPTFLFHEFSQQPVAEFLKRQETKKEILIGGDFLTPVSRLGKGWAWDDYQELYMTKRSPLPMYGNLVTIKLVDSFQINFVPNYFKSKMYGQTVGGEPGFEIFKKFDTNDIMVTGGTGKQTFKEIPFNSDFETIIELLKDTFHLHINEDHFGVGLTGDSMLLNNFNSRKYESIKSNKVKTIFSQPTDSLFKPMMHNSDNFFAEQTLLMASNELLDVIDDEAIIDTLLKSDLKDIPQQPRWVDGSGLSRYNLFTPQSFVYILSKMKKEFGMERLKTILPTGGEGTLKNYYNSDSGFVFAKTGSLSNQIALSGFVITQKNKLLAFSILVNNEMGSGSGVRRAIERFIKCIRNNY